MKSNPWLVAALLGLFPIFAQSVPEKGDREFQLSGIGIRDYDSDTTTFGASGSIGWFVTDHQKFGMRQRIHLDQSRNPTISDVPKRSDSTMTFTSISIH